MINKQTKAILSIVVVIAIMAGSAIFFTKFDKQFKLSDEIILAGEYNIMDKVDNSLSKEEIKLEIDEVTKYLHDNGLNTLIVPLNSGKDSMIKLDNFDYVYFNNDNFKKQDILKQLKNALAKSKIQLYVSMDCENLSNDDILSVAKHLHKKYAVAGIVINNYTGEKELLQQVKLSLNKGYKKYSLFLQTGEVETVKDVATLGAVDGFIAENINEEEYSLLKQTVIPKEKLLLHYSSPSMVSDIFVLNNFGDFNGGVITSLTEEKTDLTAIKLAVKKNENLPSFHLSVPNEFKITYPNDGYSTYYSGVYMTGTGDRGGKIKVNGEEYLSAKDGTFGIFLSLEKGDNIFHISQDDQTHILNITRKVGSGSGGGGTQWDGTQKYEAQEGQLVETTGDLTSVLTDKSDDSSIIAGLEKGTKLIVFSSERTTRSGKYTYAYKLSNGAYVLAKNVKWVDEVPENYVNKPTPQPTATANPTVSASPAPTPSPTPIQNTKPIYKLPKITSAEIAVQENEDEILSFAVNGNPAVIPTLTQEGLELLFLNTSVSSLKIPVGNLYSSVAISQKNEGTYVKIKYNTDNLLWGYEVTNSGDKVNIYLKKAPKLSGGDKPLTGITVLIDAGHGGKDTGAIGVSGGTGPSEKDVNLAVALAGKACLEEYGAKVLLTRSDDTFLTLEERRSIAVVEKPDVFIAVHHNSLDYSVDSSKANGSECYYFTPQSKALAQAMCLNVTNATHRKNRGAENGYYYVTRTNIAPSVLMEYAFINNPNEYSKVYTDADIYKAAYGTLQAVMSIIPQ